MVFMFSHWTEALPYRQATASSVAKVLLEGSYAHHCTTNAG